MPQPAPRPHVNTHPANMSQQQGPVTKKTVLLLFSAILKWPQSLSILEMKTGLGNGCCFPNRTPNSIIKAYSDPGSQLSGSQGLPQPARSHSLGPSTGLLTIPNPRQQRPRKGSPPRTTTRKAQPCRPSQQWARGRSGGVWHNTQSWLCVGLSPTTQAAHTSAL